MVDNADLQHEKSNPFALLGRSGKKSSSGRPSTSDGHSAQKKSFDPAATPSKKQQKDKEKDEKASRDSKDSKERPSKEQAVLRRRTSSQVSSPSRGGTSSAAAAGASAGTGTASGGEATKTTLKAGQSILQQIGQPDHNGWMRKKGERYNTWKSRYFVLKGPHLYWLRSNSSSVRILHHPAPSSVVMCCYLLMGIAIAYRKRRSKVTSISLGIRSLRTRRLIQANTASSSSRTVHRRTTSRRRSNLSSGSG